MSKLYDLLAMMIDKLNKAGGGGADWNAPEGAPGHVLNRTHWVEQGVVEILPECQPTFDEGEGMFVITEPVNMTIGETYIVNWNGVEYSCIAQDMSAITAGAIGIGNLTEMGGAGNGEPFAMVLMDGMAAAVPFDGVTELTLAIYQGGETIHKLDNKYLDLDWLPTYTDGNAIVAETTVNNGDSGIEYASNLDVGKNTLDLYDGKHLVVYMDGVRYVTTVHISGEGADGTTYAGNLAIMMGVGVGTGEPFYISFSSISSLFRWNDGAESHVVSIYEEAPNKLPEEYLPESVDGVIIRSSTEGSTKKFKLTVDDNGTITATEI